MRIVLVTPVPAGSRNGNRTTAIRWARILRSFGHVVPVQKAWDGSECDVLIALHAFKSAESIRKFSKRHPSRPTLVALTGTDLYIDLERHPTVTRSLEVAKRLIVLHPNAIDDLPTEFSGKARVLLQSMEAPGVVRTTSRDPFIVSVVAHLRAVKDPFLAARAAALLPCESKVIVQGIGEAMTASFERQARAEARRNGRYRWLGERTRRATILAVAGSSLLVSSSRAEGGANAVSEAIVLGVPVLGSRISGNLGLLGEDYPGYFDVGDAAGLADLIRRCEVDRRFYRHLESKVGKLRKKFEPERERLAWKALLAEIV